MKKDKTTTSFGKNFTSPDNKNKNNDGLIKFFGIFFILLGIVALVNTLYQSKPESILWFCYLGIFLIGLGMLWKNPILVTSQLNILTIPLLIWTVDFIHFIVTGTSLLGIVDYFFNPDFPLFSRLISMQHIFTIPVSLFVLQRMKSRKMKNSWKFSLLQLTLIFAITIFLTNQEDNINCVYHSCGNLYSGPSVLYPLVWFGSGLVLVVLTNFLILKLINIKESKN